MSKFVIVHHAHHTDERLYRLVYARATEVAEFVEVPNEEHDPQSGSSPTKLEQRIHTVYEDHQEIVWDAEDPKWEGREPADIAVEQRRIVKEAIDRRIAEAERSAAEAERATTDLGSLGMEL